MSFSAMKINMHTFQSNDLAKNLGIDSSDIENFVRKSTNGTVVAVETIADPKTCLEQIIIVSSELGNHVFDVADYLYVTWHHGGDPSLMQIIYEANKYMNENFEPDWEFAVIKRKTK